MTMRAPPGSGIDVTGKAELPLYVLTNPDQPQLRPQADPMTLTSSAVIVDELALRRYAARNPIDEVVISGSEVRFRVRQDLFRADGSASGVGRVSVIGRREFGGRVRFNPEEVLLEGAAAPEDVEYLRTMAGQVRETLGDLCRCGCLQPECACCSACDGLGTLPSDTGSKECLGCLGAGFLDVPRSGT
jgi:hypothetical protein